MSTQLAFTLVLLTVLSGFSVVIATGQPRDLEAHCWADKVKGWFHETFKAVTVLNQGIPATASHFTAQCVYDIVPFDADLVIVEFTVNDHADRAIPFYSADPSKENENVNCKGYERLIRKLLDFPNQPAVVAVHYWGLRHQNMHLFWNTPEDHNDVVNKYYGVPAVSFRNAFYHLIMTQQEGYRPDQVYQDVIHPTALGHSYLAQITVDYLKQVLELLSVLPAASSQPQAPPLPPPLFPNNWPTKTFCKRGDSFKAIVKSAEGWTWRDGWKPGYETTTPGAVLKLAATLPIQGTDDPARTAQKLQVGVGYLESYENMGVATITCESGCYCEPWELDAMHEQRTSVEVFRKFQLHVPTHGSVECIVSIANHPKSNSAGHKLKIMSFMLGEHEYVSPKDATFISGELHGDLMKDPIWVSGDGT
ncbi:hypothetical protein WJX72_005430 [[Myrmecia] bisecta]|uniref:SGNH hydrolase-type esterase domain-containing protein n=1 Tax=[Myrmecia] bisecta TaxID=41462 RepID=A0AAW1R5T8_9CHLO